eukprot:6117435-Lingulodinium_polyedra.AAC.1
MELRYQLEKTGDKDEQNFASMGRDGPFSPPGKVDALQLSTSCKVGATPIALSECKASNARMRVAIAGWLQNKVRFGRSGAGRKAKQQMQSNSWAPGILWE